MSKDSINYFTGEHYFLSNFSPSPIRFERIVFPTVEHAFQAMKTHDAKVRQAFADCRTPGEAKGLGRSVKLRPDWEDVKISYMKRILKAKFEQNPELGRKLLATGEAQLIEGNSHGDKYWGQCPLGVGENVLGKLLMARRDRLRARAAQLSKA